MNKEQMSIDPKIKKEINEEGFEENAAVLIGKKEEMPELLEKLEKEGEANDLGTYIKMHKEIKLPKEEISPDLSNALIENKGLLWRVVEEKNKSLVYNYIDKDGNVASFNLDPEKLTPTRKIIEQGGENYLTQSEFYETIIESAKELGFRWSHPNTQQIIEINKQIFDYQKRLEAETKKKKREEFDF